MIDLLHIVGARPNFMKAAPVMAACAERNYSQLLVHTGQHYDYNMSQIFFDELGLPRPDINLEVGSGSHTVQTAQIMLKLEPVLLERQPRRVVVYGDVNSTVAAALVSAKLLLPLVHVEAGLRSFDRTMPEEVNRLVTDQLADLLYTPSADGDENLIREGVHPEKIKLVGNVMIDTLIRLLPIATARECNEPPGSFGLVTLHRPSNVDEEHKLREIMRVLDELASKMPLLFPVHPRTRLKLAGMNFQSARIRLIDPLGYLDFLNLMSRSKFVITDSGGIQEETTYLKIPCLTLRMNTERPVTITDGTNQLIGDDFEKLKNAVSEILSTSGQETKIPPLWDGRAADRIGDSILKETSATEVADV